MVNSGLDVYSSQDWAENFMVNVTLTHHDEEHC